MKEYFSDGVRNMLSTSGASLAVHVGQLELVLEVGNRAQAAEEDIRLLLLDEVRQQGGEAHHLDVRQVLGDLLGQRNPLFQAEQGFFLGLAATAMITWSKSREARSIRSP